MRTAAAAAVIAGALLLAGSAAAQHTPFPPKTAGKGNESTAGSGVGAGLTFAPRFALATYDGIGGHYVLYLTSKPLLCGHTYDAKPPYLTVTVVTKGSPLVVGAPSLQTNDQNFVQVDFYVAPIHYYTVQPGVKLVFTRIDATKNHVWHGKVTVPTTHFEGKTFAFSGTFAARWCGKD